MSLIVPFQSGWSHIITTTPEMYLLLSKCLGHFSLIQTLQCTIVTFVQLPRSVDGQPLPFHFLHDDPHSLDSAAEHRSKDYIKIITTLPEQSPSLMRLFPAKIGKADIRPARESIFEIPRALSVTD